MNIAIVGHNKKNIEPVLEQHGFTVVDEGYEFVVSYGGDGTFMKSEEFYPGVPKIMLRDSAICKKCSHLPNEEVLARIARGEYVIEEVPKLKATIGSTVIEAVNDIAVHNNDPRHAIRYHIRLNGELIHHIIIGDGIVVATPFGSTGYYRSITHSSFDVGIGLAYNNSTEQTDHIVLAENSVIELEVLRGPVVVYADNQEVMHELTVDGSVKIERSGNVARVVVPLEREAEGR